MTTVMQRTQFRLLTAVLALTLLGSAARGDGLIFGFEGDVLPGGAGSDWVIANPCEPDCSRRLENGHLILEWGDMGDFVNYHLWIAQPPVAPPPTLWVEWRFRSNQLKPATSSVCDARVSINYAGFSLIARMFEDIGIASGIGDNARWIDPGIFHTYRLESPDGVNYTVAVDGFVFKARFDDRRNSDLHYIQFSGEGG